MHIILPKNRPVLEYPLSSLPLFFLAGPIQGGGDWQMKMTELLYETVGDCIVVNPSRYDATHPHYQHRLEGPVLDERQTEWERYYLQQAATGWHSGCIIFWLALQVEERTDGSPYGRDTYGELGSWRTHLLYNRELRVVVGAEVGKSETEDEGPRFPGFSVIECNFKRDLGSNYPIYETMNQVAERAVFFAQRQMSFASRVSA